MKIPEKYVATSENGSHCEKWILVEASVPEDRLGQIRDLCRAVLASPSTGTVFGLAWDILRLADPEIGAGLPEQTAPAVVAQILESLGPAEPALRARDMLAETIDLLPKGYCTECQNTGRVLEDHDGRAGFRACECERENR